MKSNLFIISFLFTLIPIIPAFYNFKFNKPLKIFSWFIWVSAIFDTAFVITTKSRIHNLPLVHLYLAVNLIFIGLVYFNTLSSKYNKIIIYFAGAILLFVIVNALFIEGINNFPSRSFAACGILFIICSLLYFYQMINNQEAIYIEKQAMFWINSGIFIYFSGNIFLFMLQNIMTTNTNYALYYNVIHTIINVVANVLYSIGLFCKPQPQI
jgi:drug/metabolite transporter superfamily protein YnfA